MDLATIVEGTLSSVDAEEIDAQLCLDILAWKSEPNKSELYRSAKVLEHKLKLALYWLGKIPIRRLDGKLVRASRIEHLRYFSFAKADFHTNAQTFAKDEKLYRLIIAIAKMSSRDDGPSLKDLSDEIGSHPLMAAKYGRAVSYNDMLLPNQLMLKYLTGQREITIRMSDQSVPRVIETRDDVWVLNPEFARSRRDERLYFFWKRARADWPDLIDTQGRRKQTINHLGGEVTYDSIMQNPKAKFIKNGALPRDVSVPLGISTMPGKSRTADVNKGISNQSELPVISYKDFTSYVPRNQLAK